jgi:hypothetical protein
MFQDKIGSTGISGESPNQMTARYLLRNRLRCVSRAAAAAVCANTEQLWQVYNGDNSTMTHCSMANLVTMAYEWELLHSFVFAIIPVSTVSRFLE